jgi:DNA polymerase III, chi subunit
MAAIGFYHLTRTGVAEAIAPLLGRTLGSGARAVVRGADPASIATLDDALWRAASPDWLPHGTAAMGFGADQPIWLTDGDDVPNGARFLFLVGGADETIVSGFDRFDRVFDLFDGNDQAAVIGARARWAAAKVAGHGLTYWQQTERGWVQKS